MENLLKTNNPIHIISGEGDYGTTELYQGKRTDRAIKLRLTKERCGGDRWAKAEIYSHDTPYGPVGIDLSSGKYTSWAEI